MNQRMRRAKARGDIRQYYAWRRGQLGEKPSPEPTGSGQVVEAAAGTSGLRGKIGGIAGSRNRRTR